ncbi:hypothetical protein PInf_009957 [Phytophthora infestans]|nr:hypothetical protein PInf_009957 [Phytophthora infestans]
MTNDVDVGYAAVAASITVHVPRGTDMFKSYKSVLTALYKRMDECRSYRYFVKIPLAPEWRPTGKGGAVRAWPLGDPAIAPPNTEKNSQLYHSICPYVPCELQNDHLYAKPTKEEGELAKTRKQARLDHCAAVVSVAKKTQE